MRTWPIVAWRDGPFHSQSRAWEWPSTKLQFPFMGYYELYLMADENFVAVWHNL